MAAAKPKGGVFDDFKFPTSSQVFAGAFGSPACIYIMTPARNACTLAAQDASVGIAGCYRRVFANGLVGGWTGGIYVFYAGIPQGLLLGPAYHAFASFAGKWGGIVLTGMCESMITYGAQTKNAQLAAIAGGKSSIPKDRIQSSFKPFGPGIGVFMSRNILAMSGMRVTCEPITRGLEKCAGQKSPAVSLAGDFLANIVAAGFTFPLNQLFNYLAVTPETWDKPLVERVRMGKQFLSDTYFVNTETGGRKLSPVLLRDFSLRVMYIATGYTLYLNFERLVIKNWPL
eukprot:TRINITY_DN45557_c0_g1_i1.p1 TRINITY_DN45557_c0_g1~~TRINITY_DN45557_c0_g1_i1.p1  ORF type:complete len:286 (+),score=31.81 TRINITY_DN45557_c0_g1_i1:103-960(+)